jgi:PAS domain S-box-containing protein
LEHRRLATIVESASEGIIVVDHAGIVTTFNPAAERMFDRPVSVAVGQPVEQLDFLTREEMSAPPLPSDQPGYTTQPIVRRRHERMLSALISPLVGAEHADGGVVWVVRDVTDLARVDEMKSEFISIVSHELRTPLTAIKGFTDLILEGDVGEISAEQREFLEIVQSNSDRLVALINDMLDISRIEAGRITLALDQVDLADAVENIVISFRPTFESKQLTFQTELADDARLVLADDARLEQILTNLVSNACKYTPDGGWITVRTVKVGRQVAVSVSDTGMGMPSDALPRLFSKFYRVDQAGVSGISGTGLGLAITKSLVELHGGRITVASRPNTGTTVRFTLPAYGVADGHPDDLTSADGAQPSAGRILLAEDDSDSARWMQRVLAARGFEVTTVPDGLAALVRAIEMLPDVIILDVDMPKMGASEVLPQLKNNPGTRDIPVIVITGTVPDTRGYFIEAGAVDFFSKPIDDDIVAARLTQLIRRRG